MGELQREVKVSRDDIERKKAKEGEPPNCFNNLKPEDSSLYLEEYYNCRYEFSPGLEKRKRDEAKHRELEPKIELSRAYIERKKAKEGEKPNCFNNLKPEVDPLFIESWEEYYKKYTKCRREEEPKMGKEEYNELQRKV